MLNRAEKWKTLSHKKFDVAIIGGGINGASLYHRLCSEGYSALLIDRGDFGGGTSQSSAMMAWGGLLYMTNFDLGSVWQLSLHRDRLIHDLSNAVQAKSFRYVSRGNKALVHSALVLYWLLGLCRRKRPHVEQSFSESSFLSGEVSTNSLVYEEAFLQPSDARFVLGWILAYENENQIPLNYCSLEGASYNSNWTLHLRDTTNHSEIFTTAKLVVNAAGVWTDQLNHRNAIVTPYKHVFGKGVFLGFHRFPEHHLPLILDSGKHEDSLSLIPWGPVSLWGPTETKVDSLETGFCADPADVRFLLDRLNPFLREPVTASQIISLRCGVRPLAVDRSYDSEEATIRISRKHRIFADQDRPWISLYGGKITSCVALAEETTDEIRKQVLPEGPSNPSSSFQSASDPFVLCCKLEDYLRRRTNLSQWLPRGGLGWENENRSRLLKIAVQIHQGNLQKAEDDLDLYEQKIKSEFDRVIALC